VMNNGTTGHGPSRFRWLTEMGELIGGQHDVNFVATGTAAGVMAHRPEALHGANMMLAHNEFPSEALPQQEPSGAPHTFHGVAKSQIIRVKRTSTMYEQNHNMKTTLFTPNKNSKIIKTAP